MTNRYRFRHQETAIAKLTRPIYNFGLNGTLTACNTDVTILNGYRRMVRGKEKVFYTVKINDAALQQIFGLKVDILDENGNIKKIKSKRTRYLNCIK